MEEAEVASIAHRLAKARAAGTRLVAFPGRVPDSLVDAYRVQDRVLDLTGVAVAGWKVAALSPESARHLKDERVCGPILQSKVIRSGETASYAAGADRKIEAELGIKLQSPLPARRVPYLLSDVEDAIEGIYAALEIAGSCVENIADMGSTAIVSDLGFNDGFVHGDALQGWRQADLLAISSRLAVDDVSSEGHARDVPGGPTAALLWLSNHLSARGIGLDAGQWVSTGCCGRMIDAPLGAQIRATFGSKTVVTLTLQGL